MRSFVLTLSAIILVASSFGQSVEELMSQGKKFEEISRIMETRFEGRSVIKGTPNYSRAYKQFKRWQFFWKHRLTSNGDFASSSLIYTAWEQAEYLARNKTDNAANWSYVGPKKMVTSSVEYYPGLGRINAIAIHPVNHQILLAGGASSGIWKSTDNGKTWTSKTEHLPSIGISDIVFDPNDHNIIYAATGDADGNRAVYSTGIYKSTDGGETWSIVGLPRDLSDKLFIRRLAMPESPANTILATTSSGIQRSTDGGSNWTVVDSKKGGSALVKKPGSSTTFYVGTRGGEILKSTDGGSNWTDISPQGTSLFARVELAVSDLDSNFLFAIDMQGTTLKSNDAGATWTTATRIRNYDSQQGYNMTLAVSPLDTNLILIGGIEGWRSSDGGTSWEKYLDGYWEQGEPYFYVHSDHHDAAFKPGTNILYDANDGGLFYGDLSKDSSFTDITEGLYTTQYYGIGVLRSDASKIIGGAQDNDGVFMSGNSAIGLIPGSDGFDGLINYSNPDIGLISITGGAIHKTEDAWATSNEVTPNNFGSAWEVPMAMHPTNPAIVFVGGNHLMKSTDNGDNWTSILQLAGNFSSLAEMDIAPSNGDVIVVADSDGEIQRTTNGGQNWTKLSSPAPQNHRISGISIHGTNPDIFYVSISGFSAGEKVYRTTDGGQTFSNISHDLPNIAVHHIAYATGTNDDIYVATDLGVYLNTNGSSNWVPFQANLPYTQVYELEINYASQTLFAATYGRGVWKSPLENHSTLGLDHTDQGDNGFQVYPTVNQGSFHIKQDQESEFEVVVYNLIGGVLHHSTLRGMENQVNLGNPPSGIYLVGLKQGGKITTHRLVIE
ncbi:T9SS type A sorting domain-containing protein [bacterium SCSIO 12741]|nr:T9SS type A sorting domain-containing protein [bacterium SCSIO 12741]